jgi:NAD(P)-dependent dehydrogenase (short-subunit alcohol dehydrogenase family)
MSSKKHTQKTIVVAGGTDGMGRAIAEARLERGDTAVIIGRDAAKGEGFTAAGGPRAHFLQADLSLIAENERVIAEIQERFPVLDAVVLCARRYLSARHVTADGLEETFALFYLSRHLFSHGLAGNLEKAAGTPVIANVAGPTHATGVVNWDDLQFERGYDAAAVLNGQGGKLNDLLGVSFAERHAGGRTRYVLVHPGSVATSFCGVYDAADAAHVAMMKRFAKPVGEGVAPILAILDDPPAEPLSAFVEGHRMNVDHPAFGKIDAARLHDITLDLLSR